VFSTYSKKSIPCFFSPGKEKKQFIGDFYQQPKAIIWGICSIRFAVIRDSFWHAFTSMLVNA
jgi:hypothetical protein